MPGEEEDVGSSALLAATSATQKKQQQQQQQAQSVSTTSIATLQQLQQSQQPPPLPSLPPPPDYHQIIPTISVNPSSVPTSGNTSLGGSGSVGDILLHHASMDDDDEDADDEDDICGSNSKLELELQFAGIDNENVELDVEDEDGLNGLPPPPGRRKVSSAHHPRGGIGIDGDVSVDNEQGGGPPHLQDGGELGEGGDVEGGKVEPAEPHEPTCAEKCLFYTTAFFILLAVFSLFAFLFLVPFVIDPAFTTIFMKFDPEPAECYTVSRENHMGSGNCSWTSCREGCTREIFNCTQIMVNYLRPKRTSSTANAGDTSLSSSTSPITSVKTKTIHNNNKRNNNNNLINTASSSAAYNSYYSSYSKSTHAHHDHDPGSSIPGVRWDTYPSASLNHILYQSTTTNLNNNNNYYINKHTTTTNNINKFSSSHHYQAVNYNNNNNIIQEDDADNDQRDNAVVGLVGDGVGSVGESTNSHSNNKNNIIITQDDLEQQPQQAKVSSSSRGVGATSKSRSSRAVLVPLLADMSDRNSVILNGNHKKKKHKVIPSSPNSNVLQSVSNSEFNIPWASSLTAGGRKSGSSNSGGASTSGGSKSGNNQQGGGGEKGDWYLGARLFPNVKGCGYPPIVNCSTFLRKYGQLGVNFSCYYSLVDPHLVVTTFDMDRVVMDLVYSMAIPIPSFIISVVYLIFAYFRIYNMDGSATPPAPSTSNPHDASGNNTNNNIGSNSGGGGGGSTGGEPDGETSLSADDKTRILQRSTSRGLNALSDKLIPNSAKGVQPLIQMNDIASSHLPADADLILPRRNNRAPERNGPTNPQAKNKGKNSLHHTRKLPHFKGTKPLLHSYLKLTEDDDDEYLNAQWADDQSLKRSFQGMRDISWRPK